MREKGVLYGIGAYLIWGFFPVYLKALLPAPALQILFHRIVGSFLFMALLLVARREWPKLRVAITSPKIILIYCLSASLLAANWFTYTWAVNAGYVVETSLGYFINPLVNVLLGVVLLRERLRPLQWLPVGLAAAGVLYMGLQLEAWPWIALVVAFTFGFYGLIKKVAPLDALHGTSLEMAILFVPALAYLIYAEFQDFGSFGHLGWSNTLLLALAGLITALPLLMFASCCTRSLSPQFIWWVLD
jgi:chloramphenicol-sensitive protein RarD